MTVERSHVQLSRINLQAVSRKASLAMLRRTWYRQLAKSNRLIAAARQRIEIQKVLISNLEREERGTRSALALLRRSEVLLSCLRTSARSSWRTVRRPPLPAELCEANPHRGAGVQRHGKVTPPGATENCPPRGVKDEGGFF